MPDENGWHPLSRKRERWVFRANSRDFVAAMKAHHVPVEYLELSSGGHGLNGCKGPLWEEWKARSLVWLAARNVIPADKETPR